MSELDQRPILKLTQFGIYDEPGHLCHLDGAAIEANHLLFACGYVKPVWNDNPGIQKRRKLHPSTSSSLVAFTEEKKPSCVSLVNTNDLF